jgi:hypothetical protein
MSKKITRTARSSARALIAEVRDFCARHQIPPTEVDRESGYTNSARLLAGQTLNLTHENESRLRKWLESRRFPEPADTETDPVPAPTPGLLVLTRQWDDPSLDLPLALAQVVEHFRPHVPRADITRALSVVSARYAP